jgi:hypothetical protein
MVCIKLLTKRARRVSIKSRSRQHVDKSTDLLSVSNFAQSSRWHGVLLAGEG